MGGVGGEHPDLCMLEDRGRQPKRDSDARGAEKEEKERMLKVGGPKARSATLTRGNTRATKQHRSVMIKSKGSRDRRLKRSFK